MTPTPTVTISDAFGVALADYNGYVRATVLRAKEWLKIRCYASAGSFQLSFNGGEFQTGAIAWNAKATAAGSGGDLTSLQEVLSNMWKLAMFNNGGSQCKVVVSGAGNKTLTFVSGSGSCGPDGIRPGDEIRVGADCMTAGAILSVQRGTIVDSTITLSSGFPQAYFTSASQQFQVCVRAVTKSEVHFTGGQDTVCGGGPTAEPVYVRLSGVTIGASAAAAGSGDTATLAAPTLVTSNLEGLGGSTQNMQCAATSGFFTLAFAGRSTRAIAHSASAAVVQAALQELTTLESVSVYIEGGETTICGSGASGHNATIVISPFASSTVEQYVPSLVADSAALAGTNVVLRVTGRGTVVVEGVSSSPGGSSFGTVVQKVASGSALFSDMGIREEGFGYRLRYSLVSRTDDNSLSYVLRCEAVSGHFRLQCNGKYTAEISHDTTAASLGALLTSTGVFTSVNVSIANGDAVCGNGGDNAVTISFTQAEEEPVEISLASSELQSCPATALPGTYTVTMGSNLIVAASAPSSAAISRGQVVRFYVSAAAGWEDYVVTAIAGASLRLSGAVRGGSSSSLKVYKRSLDSSATLSISKLFVESSKDVLVERNAYGPDVSVGVMTLTQGSATVTTSVPLLGNLTLGPGSILTFDGNSSLFTVVTVAASGTSFTLDKVWSGASSSQALARLLRPVSASAPQTELLQQAGSGLLALCNVSAKGGEVSVNATADLRAVLLPGDQVLIGTAQLSRVASVSATGFSLTVAYGGLDGTVLPLQLMRATADAVFSQQPIVRVLDAGGNPISRGMTVTAKLSRGVGATETQSLRCAATGGEFTLIAGGQAIAVAAATTASQLASLLNTAIASRGFTVSVSIVGTDGTVAVSL